MPQVVTIDFFFPSVKDWEEFRDALNILMEKCPKSYDYCARNIRGEETRIEEFGN